MKTTTEQIIELLKMKNGSKWLHTAYHLYTNLGFSKGVVVYHSMKIRYPRKWRQKQNKFNQYRLNKKSHE